MSPSGNLPAAAAVRLCLQVREQELAMLLQVRVQEQALLLQVREQEQALLLQVREQEQALSCKSGSKNIYALQIQLTTYVSEKSMTTLKWVNSLQSRYFCQCFYTLPLTVTYH